MGAPDKPDNKQDQTLVTNNEAVKNLRLNGFQTGEDARGVSRDVIPPNFIQAIEALTNSTNTLTETYTGSLNFLIDAVKEVQRLEEVKNLEEVKKVKEVKGKTSKLFRLLVT